MSSHAETLIEASETLARDVSSLVFPPTFQWIYNPLIYAKHPHDAYIRKFGNGTKRVLFLGMNPGPWGMAQTGVPFGEIRAVRDWMGIEGPVGKPPNEHPKKPVTGFSCRKSEVSGRRLWGLMEQRYPACEDFFQSHYAVNFCPVIFFSDTGKNITPDTLPKGIRNSLEEICRRHLQRVIMVLEPKYLVGVGAYAEKQLKAAAEGFTYAGVFRILHPSPASPKANRGWEAQAQQELIDYGIW